MPIRIIFLPSLKHIAIVKIAVAVFYNSRISTLIDELQELEKKFGEHTNHQRVLEKWTLVEKQVHKQLGHLLPPSLLKKVEGTLRPLYSEVQKWKRDHEEFLTPIEEDFKRILIWNSEGTVNRSKTAEEWIRSGTLDVHKRFLLACTYFLTNDVVNLWAEMNAADKSELFFKTANLAVRFWTDWLREGAIPESWFQIANESLDADNVWYNDYHIRVSCFFDKIDSFVRRHYFVKFQFKSIIHYDDLRFCFNHMDESEQVDVLRNDLYPTLISFLNWPLQSLFPKLIDDIPLELPMSAFHGIITYILSRKIKEGWKDADYVKILVEIWNCMSPTVKEQIKVTGVYVPLMVVLNRENRQPFSIEEILKSYFS